MHWQVPPHEETKTLWVTTGALYDVLVDVAPDEPTYGQWVSVDCRPTTASRSSCHRVSPTATRRSSTTRAVTYLIGGGFSPEHARTLRHDDPTVGIAWPLAGDPDLGEGPGRPVVAAAMKTAGPCC